MNETKLLLQAIVEGIQEKKGKKITVVDLSELEGLVYSYFVICEGNSTTQVSSIADSIKDYVREKMRVKPFASDGYQNSQWVVLDYGEILVHVFLRETRDFYKLESLWSDAKLTDVPDIL